MLLKHTHTLTHITLTHNFKMLEMSSSGRFIPKEYEVDYESQPCFKQYGLRHGEINRYSKQLDNEQQNMGYEDDQQSLQDLSDRSEDFEDKHLIITETPTSIPQKRMTRRRTLIQCNPDEEEPGVLEDSDEDMVSRYFKANSGKRDLYKYGKDKAVKS